MEVEGKEEASLWYDVVMCPRLITGKAVLKERRNFTLGMVSIVWEHEGVHEGSGTGNQGILSASYNGHFMGRFRVEARSNG